MKLLHEPDLARALSNTHVLVDTTTLINASKSDEYLEFLIDIRAMGCQLMTIPSVIYEFTRNAKDPVQHNKQMKFVDQLGVTVMGRIDETINADDDLKTFQLLYNLSFNKQRGQKGPSYTDSLLCTLIFKYRRGEVGLKLLSANHHDIPDTLFDREQLITIDVNGELHNEALYCLSEQKLTLQLANFVKGV